jgi:cytochrome P450
VIQAALSASLIKGLPVLHETPAPDIASHLLIDFDYFAVQAVDGDLHLGWKALHAGPDVFYTARNGGHWVVTRAADIQRIYTDTENFSNHGITLSREEREMKFAPGEFDPPEHTAYRMLLNPWFGPKPIRAMEAQAREHTRHLIDQFKDKGGCEFRSAFAQRMPIYVFLSLMQLPVAHAEMLLPAADMISRDPDPEAFMRAVHIMMGYLNDRIEERRHTPGTDFLSHLLTTEMSGRHLSHMEVLSLASNVMLGGLDTVVGTMGFMMNFLARHPEHRRQLVDDPALIPAAVDELMRRHAIANFGRLVVHDTRVGEITMREGDFVLLPTVLYNLDERRFNDPLTVDFHREDKAHFNFGGGIHRCLGLHLARLELRVMLEEWLPRIPDFRIQPGETVRASAGRINAISHLPLSWA